MRIGMILDAPFPPDARVENEARVLIQAGHEVHLLHIDFSRYQAYRNKRETESGNPSADSVTEPEAVSQNAGRLQNEPLFHNGIRLWRERGSRLAYKASALSATLPVYRWWAGARIRRFVKQSGAEVLHIHDMVIAEAAIDAAVEAGIPAVLDLHEDRPAIMASYHHVRRLPGRLLISLAAWRRKQRELMERADHVILVTEQARLAAMERDGIPLEKTTALPNVVWPQETAGDSAVFGPDNGLSQTFKLLYIGDSSLRRGTLTALESLHLLAGRYPDLQLTLVGSSSQDSVLQRYVSDHGLEDRVRFEGWQPASRLPHFIAAADLCLSPLLRNPHHDTTFANKLFLYMAGARAVVVSDCPAQAQVVREERCGLIHRAGDPASLAEAVVHLRENRTERLEMGIRGADAVRIRWNWQVTGPRLAALYERL